MDTMTKLIEMILDEEEEANALRKHLPADIRLLYHLWTFRSHASPICGEILRAVHMKEGNFNVCDLTYLDPPNCRAALRVIGLLARPTFLSDRGLEGLLSNAEIHSLFEEA